MVGAVAPVDIREVQADRLGAHQHLAGAGNRVGEAVPAQDIGTAEAVEQEGLHGGPEALCWDVGRMLGQISPVTSSRGLKPRGSGPGYRGHPSPMNRLPQEQVSSYRPGVLPAVLQIAALVRLHQFHHATP